MLRINTAFALVFATTFAGGCSDGGPFAQMAEPSRDAVTASEGCFSDIDGDRWFVTQELVDGRCLAPGVTTLPEGEDDFKGLGDCDDTADFTYPGADEICDGLDNDCDGQIDEDGACDGSNIDPDFVDCVKDGDDDGYADEFGDIISRVDSCKSNEVEVNTSDDLSDCDDDNKYVNPGEPEDCDNGVDDDCDGDIDEDDSECDGGGGNNGGGSSPEFCDIRISLDMDTRVDGDSSFYTELYTLVFGSGDTVVNNEFWPSDGNWSNNDPDDSGFDQLLAVSNGGTNSGVINDVPGDFQYVLVQGGIWETSNGGGFKRWLVGNYNPTVAGDVDGEYRCDGQSNWSNLGCSTVSNGSGGYDLRCSRVKSNIANPPVEEEPEGISIGTILTFFRALFGA